MSTAAVIGLGVLVWFLVSILLAVFVGRMIQLRDRQGPGRSPPVELSATERSGTAPPPSGPDVRDEP